MSTKPTPSDTDVENEYGSLTRVMTLIPPTAGRLSAEQKTSQYDCFSTTKKHTRDGSGESFSIKFFSIYLFQECQCC